MDVFAVYFIRTVGYVLAVFSIEMLLQSTPSP